ncbi:unnamed protein product [Rotaria sordida]|uniref:Uncharacterized protein n=1 Tax=Rotaria sordida TaxID=392033 RepID=A0A814UMR9_9BILA|nr:unnamed protein product [Rotaria sordida]
MKNKFSKRSISNKQSHHHSYQTQIKRLSTPIDYVRTKTPNQCDLSIETVPFDSSTSCLKPNIPLKSQKILKRDLLRCSNQRPSFLGPQTLQTPRIHHGFQQIHSVALSSTASSSSSSSSSSFVDHHNVPRRRSLSLNSHIYYPTINRIGPWPDISINRLITDDNDLSQPIKKFRNIKNSHVFSLKSLSSLTDNTGPFKLYPSKHTYIEEYRKNKGYILNLNRKLQHRSLSLSSSSSTESQDSDDDQLSMVGTYSSDTENNTILEETILSTTNLSTMTRTIMKSNDDIIDNTNRLPLISSVINQLSVLPSMPMRNSNYFRASRRTKHHPNLTLPALTHSSIGFLNSMNTVEKLYGNHKKISTENQSKLFFMNERPKKRYLN